MLKPKTANTPTGFNATGRDLTGAASNPQSIYCLSGRHERTAAVSSWPFRSALLSGMERCVWLRAPRLSAIAWRKRRGPPAGQLRWRLSAGTSDCSVRKMCGLQRVVEHGVQRRCDVSGRVRGVEEARGRAFLQAGRNILNVVVGIGVFIARKARNNG